MTLEEQIENIIRNFEKHVRNPALFTVQGVNGERTKVVKKIVKLIKDEQTKGVN